ncbi:hypothetical protein SEA_TUNATARTARE_151 [Streptomyces phage TunaTartare]|uniref:Uncharacterized protein n=1 Tax=Streptomyces phage TunaTartare TaxID=2848887 RepID=A0A8F2E6Q2_9CAUD|nr:hypothetical protein PP457_gp119 [Streptomyces phage TunaTartare]QWT30023.1 hypothetical protein SEA_TUNATARTARE_151 [Streptomyces phage TunaTartare]
MRVSRKKPRNPLELPWWAIKGLEWLIGQAEDYVSLDDILIKAWTKESEDEVYIEFLWPGGRQSVVAISKDTPRDSDPASCPYFRGVGKCDSGCYTEPSCQTDRPEFGWPSERYKF